MCGKVFKGVYLNGGQITKTHDLVLLNKICQTYNSIFKEIENDCIELTDYGVQMRYPFHLEIDTNDVKKAIESSQKVIELIKKLIG